PRRAGGPGRSRCRAGRPGRGVAPDQQAAGAPADRRGAAVLRGPRRRRDRGDPGLLAGHRADPHDAGPRRAAPAHRHLGGEPAMTDTISAVLREHAEGDIHIERLLGAVRTGALRRRRRRTVLTSGVTMLALLLVAVAGATPGRRSAPSSGAATLHP